MMPVSYVSADEESARWEGFPFRPADVVISTRSKSGTTWMQMICALLIFQSERFPQPLATLSPWLDHTTSPLAEVLEQLGRQQHRRFIKTHTPLDGLPIEADVFYVVVGRHPLDAAVSLYHQGENIDRRRLRELTGLPEPSTPDSPRPDLRTWLRRWIDDDASPVDEMDGLRGFIWHALDAWNRREESSNVILVHYDDLVSDLEGEMRRLAARLGISVPPERWAVLVQAARFDSMRRRSDQLAPDSDGILKDKSAFFRRGHSGAGAEALSPAELDRYIDRVQSMAPPTLLEWLNRTVAVDTLAVE